MPEPVVLQAHGKHAQCVTFTRSGRLMLSAGQDKQIRIWSVPGFKPVGAIVGHRNSVNSLSFSPDEKHLATSSSDGTVRVWSFPGGTSDLVLQKQNAARFSPSGRYLATLSTRATASLWEMPAGTRVFESEPVDRRIFALAFAPDERSLLIGGTGTIHRLDVPTGTALPAMPAHQQAVTALVVSPDGMTLASSGPPGVIKVWSTADWSPRGEVALEEAGVMALAFSPDSSRLAVSLDFYIVIISVRDAQVIERRRVGVKGVYGLSWSPDGKYLANAAADGRVRVWTL
jgi:WD40 repeat protein